MNSAERSLFIYDKFLNCSKREDMTMLRLWAEVFELPPEAEKLEDDVISCLQAMRYEMDSIRSRLITMDVPDELISPSLNRMKNITSPANLNNGWRSLWDDRTLSENRIFFGWASWVLRNEDEVDISPDQLLELIQSIDELEFKFLQNEMSPFLREFLSRQIAAIRSALQIHRAQGVKPIKAALNQVFGAFASNPEEVHREMDQASESTKAVMGQLGNIVEKAAKATGHFNTFFEAGNKLLTLGHSINDIAQRLN